MKMKLNFSHVLALASALGLWARAPTAQYDVIVTPDQFNAQPPWEGNLSQDTAGAYQGDTAAGYYWTSNYYPNSPSGTIKVPLPAGMPSGWHQYAVCEWNPKVHSQQFFVVDIAADGTTNLNNVPPEHLDGGKQQSLPMAPERSGQIGQSGRVVATGAGPPIGSEQ